jgi:hypothetical protein
MRLAREQGRILLSADTDFGELLAMSNDVTPTSVVLFRASEVDAKILTTILLANLEQLHDALITDAIVVILDDRIRVPSSPQERTVERDLFCVNADLTGPSGPSSGVLCCLSCVSMPSGASPYRGVVVCPLRIRSVRTELVWARKTDYRPIDQLSTNGYMARG